MIKILFTIVSWFGYLFLFLLLLFLVLSIFVVERLTLPIRDLKIRKQGIKYCRECLGSGLVAADLHETRTCSNCKGTGTTDWLHPIFGARLE